MDIHSNITILDGEMPELLGMMTKAWAILSNSFPEHFVLLMLLKL